MNFSIKVVMKTFPIKLLILDEQISQSEIPLFRGAIIKAVSADCSPLFHNHVSDECLRYSYPMIQYKSINGRASVLCIGEACEHMDALHSLNGVSLRLSRRKFSFKTEKFISVSDGLTVTDDYALYNISDWVALNADNYSVFRQIPTLSDKILFLENILVGNILSFAKGMGINIDKEIVCKVTDFPVSKIVRIKGTPVNAFDLSFMTNVHLPEFIGLGRNVSFGFGVITKKQI